MNDEDYFLRTYKDAALDIKNALQKAADLVADTFPPDDRLRVEAIRFLVNGGKRLRPALSLIVAKQFGFNQVFPHLALEVFHKYLLVHDDIIDQDKMRYGAPTVHSKMEELCSEKLDKEHFGNSLGIIAGDLMEAATHKIILSSDVDDKIKIDLEKIINIAIEEVAWGWYDQFLMDYLPLDSKELNFERIEQSIIWVTGKYSLKLPLKFGFAMAGLKTTKELEGLADSMGALFQTGDDIIGLFGRTEETGKSNFGDILQGKKTLPMWLSYQKASDKDKKTLNRLVGNKQIESNEVEIVRQIIKKSGGFEASQQLMTQYRDKSLAQLEKIDLPEDLKKFLRGFISYLEKRER